MNTTPPTASLSAGFGDPSVAAAFYWASVKRGARYSILRQVQEPFSFQVTLLLCLFPLLCPRRFYVFSFPLRLLGVDFVQDFPAVVLPTGSRIF